MNPRRFAPCLPSAVDCAVLLMAQSEEKSPHGKVERIKVHGKALEGNLEGDSPDRDVSIYLPPSYATERNRRYPVIYLLHGYTDSDELWFGSKPHFINIPDRHGQGARERQRARNDHRHAQRLHGLSRQHVFEFGTTGDWETFIARDLVSYIDSHYRTIPEAASRGLAGHSMGGYGTVRIGMKNPDVFSSLYILSPCCMSANINPKPSPKAEAIQKPGRSCAGGFRNQGAAGVGRRMVAKSKEPAIVSRSSL